MSKCWLLLFENCAGAKGHGYISANTISTIPGSCGVILIIDGQNTGIGEKSATWIDATEVGPEVPADYATNYGNSCTPAPPAIKYDCLNGACIPASQYKTPGIYQSLSDCQAVCANGGACASGKKCVDPTTFCPDGKVCLDQGEFDSVEALISKIGSEVC